MALTTTEEALVRQLLDQQAAILSLAGNEATITSKLGATKVTLADLLAANSLADADLLLTRQGTTDKSVRADILAAYMAASSTFKNKYLAIPTMELTSVPSQKVAPIICVTQPHLRMMIWNGSQYVRAPWHQPCQLFFSYDNPASIAGALQVRADVSYQQSNYPDVVQRLGLSGSGTFTLIESRGEFLRVLDNGRGVDVSRAARSAQSDQLQLHMHYLPTGMQGTNPSVKWGVQDQYWERLASGVNPNPSGAYPAESANTFPDGQAGNFGSETRPRNIAFPLWMTI